MKIDDELIKSLTDASASLQESHRKARAAGREDIAQKLRDASWDVAAALACALPDRSKEVVS